MSQYLVLTETKLLNLRTKWEQELECTFEDSRCESICEEAPSFSQNSRHKLLQFNIIHRTYLTPQRLHRINESISHLCPPCKTETGNLIHIFWKCHKFRLYWGSILEILKEMIGFEISSSPKLAWLGNISDIPLSKRNKLHLIKLAMMAANKCIAVWWKSADPPPVSMWLKEMSSYMTSEKIMFNLKRKPHLSDKCCSAFRSYMGNISQSVVGWWPHMFD